MNLGLDFTPIEETHPQILSICLDSESEFSILGPLSTC